MKTIGLKINRLDGSYKVHSDFGMYFIEIKNNKITNATGCGVWCINKTANIVLGYFRRRNYVVRRLR